MSQTNCTLAPPLVDLKHHVDILHQCLNAPDTSTAWLTVVNREVESIADLIRPAVPRVPIKRCTECDEPAFGGSELCAVCRTAEGAYDEADAKLDAMHEEVAQ